MYGQGGQEDWDHNANGPYDVLYQHSATGLEDESMNMSLRGSLYEPSTTPGEWAYNEGGNVHRTSSATFEYQCVDHAGIGFGSSSMDQPPDNGFYNNHEYMHHGQGQASSSSNCTTDPRGSYCCGRSSVSAPCECEDSNPIWPDPEQPFGAGMTNLNRFLAAPLAERQAHFGPSGQGSFSGQIGRGVNPGGYEQRYGPTELDNSLHEPDEMYRRFDVGTSEGGYDGPWSTESRRSNEQQMSADQHPMSSMQSFCFMNRQELTHSLVESFNKDVDGSVPADAEPTQPYSESCPQVFLVPPTPNIGVSSDFESKLAAAEGTEVSSPVSITTSSVSEMLSATPSSVSEVLCCDECGQPFTGRYRRGNRGRHVRQKHRARHELVCESPGCGRVFLRQDSRLKHYRRHHPELAAPAVRRGMPHDLRGIQDRFGSMCVPDDGSEPGPG